MIPFQVIVSLRAAGEIERAVAWWRAHRSGSLLMDELTVAFDQLSRAPSIGVPFASRIPGVRRWLLGECHYQIYYSVDEATRLVRIRALWHAARGRTPRL